jgi:hypothetical protein
MDRLRARLAVRGSCGVVSVADRTDTRHSHDHRPQRQSPRPFVVWVTPEDQQIQGQERKEEEEAEEKEQGKENERSVDQPLIDALLAVARQFRDAQQHYRARAADEAVRLVREGRADDINPGLWARVADWERSANKLVETSKPTRGPIFDPVSYEQRVIRNEQRGIVKRLPSVGQPQPQPQEEASRSGARRAP